MESLEDQLKSLGLGHEPRRQHAEKPNKLGKSISAKPAKQKSKHTPAASPSALALELPRLGKVARLSEELGFGHLMCAGVAEDVFFHVRSRHPSKGAVGELPAVGTLVVFIMGSNARHPDKKQAVRWACVDDIAALRGIAPLDQAAVDTHRRMLLEALPVEALGQLMCAGWYAEQWCGLAPVDLEDAVLSDSAWARLSRMDAVELTAGNMRTVLAQSRYAFAAALLPENSRCAVDRLAKTFAAEQLVVLGAPDAAWMRIGHPPPRRRLMEWRLLSEEGWPARGDWSDWFTGGEAFEGELAAWFRATGRPHTALTRRWIPRLAAGGMLSPAEMEEWGWRSDEDAIALFEYLPDARQQQCLAAWRQQPAVFDALLRAYPERAPALAGCVALAIDLETDGERIWEVGCARGGEASLLFAEQRGMVLDSALADLRERIRGAALLVGHNLLAWDWPILSARLGIAQPPLIWDTLLVQYLLEPSARSHALGASHHADGDSQATLDLFFRQLQQLPAGFASQLLLGAFKDVRQLLDGIVMALGDGSPLARSLPVVWSSTNGEAGPVVLLPEHRLGDVDWVPGVVVVQADPDERLPSSLWQIDGERLEQELAAAGFDSPAAQVLLAVMWMAQAQGIVLRWNMIPLWLSENAHGFAETIMRACTVPSVDSGYRVSPLPASAAWWVDADPASYRVARENDGALIVGRERVAAADRAGLAADLRREPLVRFAERAFDRWWVEDKAARKLKVADGWRAFRVVRPATELTVALSPRHAGKPAQPVLATRRHAALHPGADDQAAYWLETLRTFHEVARAVQGTVPILLVSSTASRELLDLLVDGLVEIGAAERRPVHRSRREHLLRAARSGFLLAVHLDEWPAWRSLADSADLTLAPVLEALPLEEWYASAQAALPAGVTDVQAAASNADEAATATAVTRVELLEALPGLVRGFLANWLEERELATATQPAWIIDARAGRLGHALHTLVTLRPMDEAPLPRELRERLAAVLAPLRIERETAPSDVASMERFLVEHWQPAGGHSADKVRGFKDSQRPVMEAICTRTSDVLVPLPTGEGKSVLFQVPALCRGLRNRRLTLVISPLKALMKDQVARLRGQGFAESADYLTGDLAPYEVEDVMQGVLDHRIVLLYVAPERLRSPVFLDVLDQRIESDGGLEHVVVDEAHCINQWGYQFRPDYFHALDYLLGRLRGEAEEEPSPFLLLSATVTTSDRACMSALLAVWPSKYMKGGLVVRPEAFSNPLRSHIAVVPQRVRGLINDKDGFAQAVEERLPAILDAIGKARRNKETTGQRSAVIVFVAWRTQAEELAALLARQVGDGVDYYHAGLDTVTRDEVYTRFREGELDVLVATKAFGMGMDIPDIHWVVHLGPPAFVEDYLQEVGRIGRGVAERQRARLENLDAVLLFSDEDFEHNRNMQAQGALQLPAIAQVHQELGQHAEKLGDQHVVFVPQHGYESYKTEGQKRANATRLRMSLHWLEKAGAITLHGAVADLLTVDLHPEQLRTIAAEQGLLGNVAGLILQLEEQDGLQVLHDAAPSEKPGDSRGWLSRVLDGLGEALGIMLDRPAKPKPVSLQPSHRLVGPVDQGVRSAVINLSQIRARCAIKTMSEVMVCLVDLQKRGGLTLHWTLGFAARPMATEPKRRVEALFASVGGAVGNLLGQFGQRTRVEFAPFELLDEAWNIEQDKALKEEEQQRLRRRYERAYLHGFRVLARASGLRVRQIVRSEGKVIWEASLLPSKREEVRGRSIYLLKAARSLFRLFKQRLDLGQANVAVAELIAAMQAEEPTGRFRKSDLGPLLHLLAAMSLVSARPEMLPMSLVVVWHDTASRLAAADPLWQELKQVNDLAEMRAQAMEVFANLPTEARDGFIEGYFAQKDAEGLKAFLDSQLGYIEDAGDAQASSFIARKREQLRATEAIKFFHKYEESEEPSQWEVIRHPYDRHLLVNAGPGAGKTSVLVGRIAYLIREQQIKPAEIVVLAFNRAVVFEIKKRVRELFASLGYGSYVRRVRVSTFHSLAMRSLMGAGVDGVRSRSETLLADFAGKLASDTRFRDEVAGGCRCILVDEFQDVTEDVYTIIHQLYLGSGSRAGVMAIGDDDQDILRWQRRKSKELHEFSEHFFRRFQADFADGLTCLELCVNFRSGRAIVECSQKMITGSLQRNAQSARLKQSLLRPRTADENQASVERVDSREEFRIDALEHVAEICGRLREGPPGSLAILCRSNAEVAQTYHRLAPIIPGLAVQGTANLRVAELRHVALWVQYLERELLDRDRVLSDALKGELFTVFRQQTDIPDLRSPGSSSVRLADLWNLHRQEHAYARISTLVRFVKDLQTDELGRLLGSSRGAAQAVVSTIHKVKGLEFDRVVVLPSVKAFGRKGASTDELARDAAEEARLLYVAMTRAKTHLTYFAGEREYAWARTPPEFREGSQGDGKVLVGKSEDVGLGWSVGRNRFNQDPEGLQDYIEREVCVGDVIELGGLGEGAFKGLMHRGRTGRLRQVGFLALKHGAGTTDAALEVSAVIRWRLNDIDPLNVPLPIIHRGWGYVVLVAGRLR